VIGHGDCLVGAAHACGPSSRSPSKGGGAGHFVDEVTSMYKKAGTIVGFVRDMGIPDFIHKAFWGHVAPLPL